MEGLAAASSITGILSLAGQTLDGILKLHDFFSAVAGASKTLDRFLRDINLLVKTIEEVKLLLGLFEVGLGGDLKVAALEIQLQDCEKDVHGWLAIAREHHPGFSSGTKKGFKKFWVAVNKGLVSGIESEIRGHRHSLVASLSVLGRTLDVSNSEKLTELNAKLDRSTGETEVFRRQSSSQLSKIESLDRRSKESLRYCRSSKSSLQRIASTLSRLERSLSGHALSRNQRAVSFAASQPEDRPLSPIPSYQEDSGVVRGFSLGQITRSDRNNLQELSLAAPLKQTIPLSKKSHVFTLGGSSSEEAESCSSLHKVRTVPGYIPDVLKPRKQTSFNYFASTKTRKSQGSSFLESFDTDNVEFVDKDAVATDSEDWDDYSEHDRAMKNELSTIDNPLFAFPRIMTPPSPLRDHLLDTSLRLKKQPVLNEALRSHTTSASSIYSHVRHALLKTSPMLPKQLRFYLRKSRLLGVIKQEMALISLNRGIDNSEIDLEPLQEASSKLERQLAALRTQCLEENIALHQVDEILNACHLHDPETGLMAPQINTSSYHHDLLALRKKALKTKPAWTSKLDRINNWLFDNLSHSTDNAALHRSMLPSGQSMSEKDWARSVIKFWSIDEAAMGDEYLGTSSRGAVGSWGDSRGAITRYKIPEVFQRLKRPVIPDCLTVVTVHWRHVWTPKVETASAIEHLRAVQLALHP